MSSRGCAFSLPDGRQWDEIWMERWLYWQWLRMVYKVEDLLVIHTDEMLSGRKIHEGKKLIVSEKIRRIWEEFWKWNQLQNMLQYQERNSKKTEATRSWNTKSPAKRKILEGRKTKSLAKFSSSLWNRKFSTDRSETTDMKFLFFEKTKLYFK